MTKTPKDDPGLEAVLSKLDGPAGVAKHFDDLTPQAVSQWKRIPHKRLKKLAEVTGIPASTLRPDLAEALAA